MGEDAKFFSILIIAFLIMMSFVFFQKIYEKKMEHECFVSSGKKECFKENRENNESK